MPRSVVATDNFNRASLGSDWAQLRPGGGNLTIDTNRLASTGIAAGRWVGAGTFTNNQYAVLKLTTINVGSTGYIGVVVRASGDTDSARDYYELDHFDGSGTPLVELYRTVNGSVTLLDSRASPFVNGNTIELEAQGTTLRAMRNGQTLYTITDSMLTTGNPGAMNEPNLTLFGDDWEGGNLVAGAPWAEPALFGGQTIYRLPARRWG